MVTIFCLNEYSTVSLMFAIVFSWLGNNQCSSRYSTMPSSDSKALRLHHQPKLVAVELVAVVELVLHGPDETNSYDIVPT